MKTMLQERHRPLFASLAPEQMALVWNRVVEAWPADMRKFLGSEPSSPGDLFEVCREAGLDHARVVLSLAREIQPLGITAIETLVGRPILPWAATVEAEERIRNPPKARPAPPPVKPPDARMVELVQKPNPHREGTGMWKAYEKWEVGKTVGELTQRGMPARSIRRDVRHGYVVVK